uniref:EB domain-containing protein n=1 Tax=Elaeophora elaphi TaxID=1147741 RepID=A0A0R3RUC4_9BILA
MQIAMRNMLIVKLKHWISLIISVDGAPGDVCEVGYTKCTGNSICINNHCKCISNQVSIDGQCTVLALPNHACVGNVSCIGGSVCLLGVRRCPSGMYAESGASICQFLPAPLIQEVDTIVPTFARADSTCDHVIFSNGLTCIQAICQCGADNMLIYDQCMRQHNQPRLHLGNFSVYQICLKKNAIPYIITKIKQSSMRIHFCAICMQRRGDSVYLNGQCKCPHGQFAYQLHYHSVKRPELAAFYLLFLDVMIWFCSRLQRYLRNACKYPYDYLIGALNDLHN